MTTPVDRNINLLTPTNYMAKIQAMAMRASRNKIAALALLGDSDQTHTMLGMINGTNKAGSSIVKKVNGKVSAQGKGVVDETFIDNLYFEYGDDLTVGGNAMLFLNKKDLKLLGLLRGTNEKAKLFGIVPMPGDACRGTITDGGTIVPFLVSGAITEFGGKSQEATTGADILTAIYGDPQNYLLGLFSDLTVRIEEHQKASSRQNLILCDALIGGNVVANNGFVINTLPKASS